MKNIKKLAVAFILFIGVTTYTNAQSKVAHIDVQQLLTEMPAYQQVQTELQKLEQTYTADIQASVKEIQAKTKAIQEEINGLTDEQIKAREEEFNKKAMELQSMEASIQETRQTLAQDLQQKSQEKLAPLYKKIQDAIDAVAAAQGYDYVLNSAQGGGVIVANGKDLLADVKKQLGI